MMCGNERWSIIMVPIGVLSMAVVIMVEGAVGVVVPFVAPSLMVDMLALWSCKDIGRDEENGV